MFKIEIDFDPMGSSILCAILWGLSIFFPSITMPLILAPLWIPVLVAIISTVMSILAHGEDDDDDLSGPDNIKV